MELIKTYKTEFLQFLNNQIQIKEPKKLYEPIKYILDIGGKRLRPILCQMSCESFKTDSKIALNAAVAIEVFHNFTLLHDDVMDNASIRRGKKTVHNKWDVNTAILSGDAMLILSNKFLENYTGNTYKELMILFNQTALQVCEGQQYDMDFETNDNVSLDDYLLMIQYKTAVLVACSLQFGTIVAGASKKNQKAMYQFGLNLGIAFQLQDDYLDTFGTSENFGKKIGGDILENKKTYLYLKLLELADDNDKQILKNLEKSKNNPTQKINTTTTLYKKYKIQELIKSEILKYSESAFEYLNQTTLNNSEKNIYLNLGNSLIKRNV